MKEVTIDCRGFIPRSSLHSTFAQALSFPDHYGSNLDALHDCLTDIGEDTLLLLLHWEAAEKELGSYAVALRRVLSDSAAENPHLHITFQ